MDKNETQAILNKLFEVECMIRDYKNNYEMQYTCMKYAIKDKKEREALFKQIIDCFEPVKYEILKNVEFLKTYGIEVDIENIYPYPIFKDSQYNRRIVSKVNGIDLEDYKFSKGIYKDRFLKDLKDTYGKNYKEFFKCGLV